MMREWWRCAIANCKGVVGLLCSSFVASSTRALFCRAQGSDIITVPPSQRSDASVAEV
jgi:hypothetical protein